MCNRLEAADSLNPGFRRDDRCAKCEIESFSAFGDEYTRSKIGRCTERFKFPEETVLRNTAIKTSDCPGLAIFKLLNYIAKVIGTDAYVAIRYDKDLVACLAGHERQIVHFAVLAEERCARDEPDPAFGIL